MSLTPPIKVRKLQEALHAKAKSASAYRFYALYDKVHRLDVLSFAYGCCFANQGVAGVDGQTFEDIEAYGWERWVDELAAYRIVDAHACFRLRPWLGRRERVQGSSRSRYSEPYLRRTYGLVKLEGRPRPPSCASCSCASCSCANA